MYFCRGITREIVHVLSMVGSIVVVDRSVNTALSGAAMIISGSVRKPQEMLRITTQITDVLRGCILWSDLIDRRAGDTFTIQEEIAKIVTETVRTELLGDAGGRNGMHRSIASKYISCTARSSQLLGSCPSAE